MSQPPDHYERIFDFTDFSAMQPNAQQPGQKIDQELNAARESVNDTIDRLNEIQRDDGKVRSSALDTTEFTGIVNAATTTATNAAASATASASTATTKASEATASATTAGNAATSATGSAGVATAQAGLATTAATTATTKATEASNSAASALASQTSATASAATATTKAAEASGSAATATTQASNAAISASTATAQGNLATAAAVSAGNSASSASTSAISASNSASAAASSASAAAGSAASFSLGIGTTTTGAAGSSASASVFGTAPSYLLSLTIPRGDTGATGATGAVGATGATGPQGPAGINTWGSITGTLSSQTDLNSALALKANLASPSFSGTPLAPSPSVNTNTAQIATAAFVRDMLMDCTWSCPPIVSTTTVTSGTGAAYVPASPDYGYLVGPNVNLAGYCQKNFSMFARSNSTYGFNLTKNIKVGCKIATNWSGTFTAITQTLFFRINTGTTNGTLSQIGFGISINLATKALSILAHNGTTLTTKATSWSVPYSGIASVDFMVESDGTGTVYAYADGVLIDSTPGMSTASNTTGTTTAFAAVEINSAGGTSTANATTYVSNLRAFVAHG